MHERQEAKAKALHDILNLRPDQDAAFQAFQAAMAPSSRMNRRDGQNHEAEAALSTPQRLDHMADRMARRQAEFQQRASAIKQFYSVLSPEQQRAFDALQALMGSGPQGHADGGARGHFGGPNDKG